VHLGYVPQEPPFDPELTVFEAVVAGMGEVSRLLAEYHAVSHALADESAADQTGLLERLHHLQGELEARNAWSFETQAERVIQRFTLDPDARSARSPAGRRSVWRWRRRSPFRPKCCCSTSRRITSTSAPSSGWKTC
jgi:ATP-binding cassette subfamily F protein uup